MVRPGRGEGGGREWGAGGHAQTDSGSRRDHPTILCAEGATVTAEDHTGKQKDLNRLRNLTKSE